ncbi:hypothetical protein [Rhizobium sp. N122]|uniref:hypothetical protein n=1 Tax=Rhizobium sp. N122 TaxID=1764272 RepID=UPI00167E3084|nr:hypothetical protein [Rhizobium sp. N122]
MDIAGARKDGRFFKVDIAGEEEAGDGIGRLSFGLQLRGLVKIPASSTFQE